MARSNCKWDVGAFQLPKSIRALQSKVWNSTLTRKTYWQVVVLKFLFKISLKMSRSQPSSSLVSQTCMKTTELLPLVGIVLCHIFWQVQAKMVKSWSGIWSSQSPSSSLWSLHKARTWATSMTKTRSKRQSLRQRRPKCFGTPKSLCNSLLQTTWTLWLMCGTCVTQTIPLLHSQTSTMLESYPFHGVFLIQPLLCHQVKTNAQLWRTLKQEKSNLSSQLSPTIRRLLGHSISTAKLQQWTRMDQQISFL